MTLFEILAERQNPVTFDAHDRFIFFPNNKVCQRSITRVALKDRVIIRKDDEDRWLAKLHSIDDGYVRQMFKFTFVRNPFDRVVSAFTYLRQLEIIPREYGFTQFCVEVLAKAGVSYEPHFQKQCDGLFHDEMPLVDYIGRYERLSTDWTFVAAQIGVPGLHLPHVGRSPRRRKYQSYYDDASRRIIADLYREDLEMLDYAYEPLETRDWPAPIASLIRLVGGRS